MEVTGLNLNIAHCSVLRLKLYAAFSDSKYSYDIFKYARNAIDPNVDINRFEMLKSGLLLFSRHASQFRQYLVDDYKVLHSLYVCRCIFLFVRVCVYSEHMLYW